MQTNQYFVDLNLLDVFENFQWQDSRLGVPICCMAKSTMANTVKGRPAITNSFILSIMAENIFYIYQPLTNNFVLKEKPSK